MGKLLIWFGILYSNLVAMVGLAVLIVWWTGGADGQQFCQSIGLGLTGCRGMLLVLDVLIMGTATFTSFRNLSRARKSAERDSDNRNQDGSH
jgi:hypothetical protein